MPAPAAPVLWGPKGAVIPVATSGSKSGGRVRCRASGCLAFHFHDLRHTGNHLAAQSKVSTRELMNRMGRDSMRAALIYQHGSEAAARAIADAMDALADSDDGVEGDSE